MYTISFQAYLSVKRKIVFVMDYLKTARPTLIFSRETQILNEYRIDIDTDIIYGLCQLCRLVKGGLGNPV